MDEFFDQLLFSSMEDTDTQDPANCLMGTFKESPSTLIADNDMFERPNKQVLPEPDILSSTVGHSRFDNNVQFSKGGNIQVSLQGQFLQSPSGVSVPSTPGQFLHRKGPSTPGQFLHSPSGLSRPRAPGLVSPHGSSSQMHPVIGCADKRQCGSQSGQQMLENGDQESVPTANNVLGGAPNARVRASRGQATDRRSIAVRECRRKIAKNMQSLHNLVPNAKTRMQNDKGSALDEIIAHIEFLQQRIKDLSTTKLGGTGADEPQFVNVPAEGCNSHASAAVDQASPSLSLDSEEFENTVLGYMQKDMNATMEYLQSKGFSLIPVAQAKNISNPTRNPQIVPRVPTYVDGPSSSKQPASEIVSSLRGVTVIGSAGIRSDFPSMENDVITRGREIPTNEPNEEDFLIISSLRDVLEK